MPKQPQGEAVRLPRLRYAQARNDIPFLLLRALSSVIASAAKQSQGIIISMNRQYYVYIMTNSNNTVLYTGVTNDLKRRAYEHKEKLVSGFTRKYNITKLVYYEVFEDIENAILREKQIKAGPRQKKIQYINSMNSEWRDLYEEL